VVVPVTLERLVTEWISASRLLLHLGLGLSGSLCSDGLILLADLARMLLGLEALLLLVGEVLLGDLLVDEGAPMSSVVLRVGVSLDV
jgi:hypothetical protein